MADINISVAFDSAKAEQSAKNLDNKLKDMGTSAEKAKSPFDGLWKQIFAGVAVTAIAGKALHEFTDFIKGSITAAIEAEKVDAALKSALGATGREADTNSKHFIEYAKSLQKSTIYNDEAIKSAQTLLIQLTSLDRDGIDRATRGAIGLSSVLGIDLQSAAMMVTKAMEGNYVALSRYGIKVKETGTAEEKRAELLEKLESFYKRATDATGTFAGATAQLKNNLEEFKEAVGKAIIENAQLKKVMEDASLILQHFAKDGGEAGKAVNVLVEVGKKAMWTWPPLGLAIKLVSDHLHNLADEQRELNRSWAAGQEWAEKYNKYFIDLAKSGKDLSGTPILKFLVDLAKGTKEGGLAFKTTDEWAKQFGVRLRTDVQTELDNTRLALARLTADTKEKTPGAIEALNKKIKDLETYLKGIPAPAKKAAAVLTDELVPAARSLNDVFAKTPFVVAQAYVKSASALSVWVKKNKDSIEAIVAFSQQALGLIQSAYSNYYANQTAKLDEESKKKQEAMDAEYERRKKDIEDSMMSEAEKQTALAALDKEYKDAKELAEKDYEAKKKKLQKEAAEKQKAVAIVAAIINTAEAVSKALTLLPPMNFIMAALVGAMGLAQIALIKSQAIPLAKGAMFDRPTLLAGGRYEVGDRGLEAALPVEPLMKRIEAVVAKRGGDNIYLTVPIYLDGQKIDQRIIKVVTRQADLHRFKIPSAIVS
jgi:uncharacterized membrane protein